MDISYPFLNLKSLNITLNKMLAEIENHDNSTNRDIKTETKRQEENWNLVSEGGTDKINISIKIEKGKPMTIEEEPIVRDLDYQIMNLEKKLIKEVEEEEEEEEEIE